MKDKLGTNRACVKGGHWNLNDTCCTYGKCIHGVYAEYKVLTNIQYDKVEDMIPDSRRPNGRENDMYNERDNGPHISKQLSDHYGV